MTLPVFSLVVGSESESGIDKTRVGCCKVQELIASSDELEIGVEI